jgi:hypothetical protein
MIVHEVLRYGDKPTLEQIHEIHEASKRQVSYDEDSPKLTPEMIERFKQAVHERNARKKL